MKLNEIKAGPEDVPIIWDILKARVTSGKYTQIKMWNEMSTITKTMEDWSDPDYPLGFEFLIASGWQLPRTGSLWVEVKDISDWHLEKCEGGMEVVR
jgi:hypothetical protein